MGNDQVESFNSRKTNEVRDVLTGLSLRDKIEIIANVLIQEAAARMNIENLTPENIVEVVLEDKKVNGETLQNAVLHQGLLMLMWLNSK